MSIRPSSIVFMTTGILLIVAAAVLRFVLVPAASKMPDDLDVTNRFEGTGTLLDPAALQSGDIDNLIATDVPLSIDRHTYVASTNGDTAITHDNFVIQAPGGISMPSNHTYAIDRTTMQAADLPGDAQVEPHDGITIGLPLHPDPSDGYQLYDSATRTTVPMEYVGSDTVQGRDVLNFTVDAAGPLADTAVLGALPAVLPKAQLGQIAPALPADVLAKLTPEVLAALPDPVPVKYTAATTYKLAMDRTVGTPIDGSIDQQIIANVAVRDETIAVLAVMTMDVALAEASIDAAADTASSVSRLLAIASTITPIGLVILAVTLLAIGVVRRKPAESVPSSPSAVDGDLVR